MIHKFQQKIKTNQILFYEKTSVKICAPQRDCWYKISYKYKLGRKYTNIIYRYQIIIFNSM